MKFASLLAAMTMIVAPLAAPSIALAHTRVVASTPAEGATVARPRAVTLTFSEALLPPTAAASIVMTAMPGMANHGEMVIRNFTTAWSNGNKTWPMPSVPQDDSRLGSKGYTVPTSTAQR